MPPRGTHDSFFQPALTTASPLALWGKQNICCIGSFVCHKQDEQKLDLYMTPRQQACSTTHSFWLHVAASSVNHRRLHKSPPTETICHIREKPQVGLFLPCFYWDGEQPAQSGLGPTPGAGTASALVTCHNRNSFVVEYLKDQIALDFWIERGWFASNIRRNTWESVREARSRESVHSSLNSSSSKNLLFRILDLSLLIRIRK